MMAKKMGLISVRLDDRFHDWLGRQVIDLDTDASKLIRLSLLLAIPQIKACPTLLERVVDEDFKLQSDSR
jgi:hypothetical protein